MRKRSRLVVGAVAVLAASGLVGALVIWWPGGDGRFVGAAERVGPAPQVPAPHALPPAQDLSAANRQAPVPGLPDWSHAGYRGGADLPGSSQMNTDGQCVVTPDELAGDYQVRPDDQADDSDGLQRAIDAIAERCSPKASYDKLSLITLPAGVLDVSRQLRVHADYLVIRGAGSDPESGTRFVFRPDENTRYDTLTKDGGDWEEDDMKHGDAKGGWLWPGRGLFRVQSREVHEDYQEDYASAPANRRDLFEGTVNVHWKAGVKLAAKPGDTGFSARTGDTVVYLAKKPDPDVFKVDGFVNIRAANTMKFYEQQQALPTDHKLQNLHMRQQIFAVRAVDRDARTITLDKPLEFDVPVDSVSDGSAEIAGDSYDSKAAPLVDPVVGVGLENFHLTQVAADGRAPDVTNDYGNAAPAAAMHGIVLKWVVDSWVRGVATYRTGSHPIVTEEAKNLEIVGNSFDGSWNKGKGGNGYVRGSRVWDSIFAGNVLRNLRHFTFQWSASGNVFLGNDTDADVNLHGGWERRNLVELNTVKVGYAHRPGNCRQHCGGEGGETDADDTAWYPIWWGAGKKAVKWSGATGPQNVFFGNVMSKQTTDGGPFAVFYPAPHTIYQFGWDGTSYRHLTVDGHPIEDWAGNEQADYTAGNGVDASRTDPGPSLFLKKVA